MTEGQSVNTIGLVAIGRNEGDRLVDCIQSCKDSVGQVVYVDTCSTDDSADKAKDLGAVVLELDMSLPFTAARSRNTGMRWLLENMTNIRYIQFVDGDCAIDADWLEVAKEFLEQNPEYAVVCGRRKERYPEKTIYNKLCDIEWNSPIGDAKNCGGDALYRVSALTEVDGFNETLIAGEEPDLCFRMRTNGWKVYRYDAPMTYHDADMTRFSQWWKRTVRSGHGYAEGMYMHGRSPERYNVRDSFRIWLWAVAVPVFILGVSWAVSWWLLLLWLAYPLQTFKIARYQRKRGYSWRDALLYGFFIMLGKFPQLLGQLKFFWGVLTGKRTKLIEYK